MTVLILLDTLVGSRGISLSGGQKQRLTLARAVYAKKELVIIDDAFSGLDAETEERVFVGLLGKQGLLRQLGSTVVLATHAIHRVSYADLIIALDASGQVSEQGSFDQLRKAGGYVESLATRHKFDSRSEKFGREEGPDRSSRKRTVTTTSTSAEDTFMRPRGELATYKYYFSAIGWRKSLISFSMIILSTIFTKSTELVLNYWTAAVAKRGNEVNSFYLGIFCTVAALDILTYIGGVFHFFLVVVPSSAETLHARLLKSVMSAPLHFFSSTDTGITTNRFVC